MSNALMKALKEAARAELSRRKGEYSPTLPITLSPEQEAFIVDPSKRKVGRCGRRGGKTIALIVYFIRTMLNKPNARCLYLALTRDQAKEICWQPILDLLKSAGIRHVASKSELKITLYNGSFLRLFGADSDKAKNRLLGQPWDLVGVDECGYVGEVDELVTRVIEPSLMDYGGTICLTSSPPTVFKGLFWEADQGRLKKHWSQHHWTIEHNPFFKGRWEKLLNEVVDTKFGENKNHPTYRREYLGQWVAESEDRIYPVDRPNIVSKIPEVTVGISSWTVLGLDLGLRDSNAIVVLRCQDDQREAYELESWAQNNMTVDQLAAVLTAMMEKHKAVSIVADTGGYGAGICNELRSRYGFSIIAADKRDKGFYQEMVKADMLSGYCKFLPDSGTVKEMQLLVRDAKTGFEDVRCENHRSDAYLYAYRYIYNRHLRHYAKPKSQEERMIEQLVASVRDSDKPKDEWGESDEF